MEAPLGKRKDCRGIRCRVSKVSCRDYTRVVRAVCVSELREQYSYAPPVRHLVGRQHNGGSPRRLCRFVEGGPGAQSRSEAGKALVRPSVAEWGGPIA